MNLLKNLSKWFSCLCILWVLIVAAPTLHADEVVVTSRGVAGDMDSENRDPVLSVGRNATPENVKLLVDAYIENNEYKNYPIKFEFFVNRNLILAQIRSPELPGPIGIDIPPTTATMPFNYTVSACMIHPNQSFCTVINGAADGTDDKVSYNCTLTLMEATGDVDEDEDAIGGETTDYSAEGVTLENQGVNSYAFSFTAKTEDHAKEATITGTLKVEDQNATSLITVKTSDETDPVEASGTAVTEDDRLSSFKVSDDDETLNLSCKRSE
ncbi:MAG: hypothetical protein GX589_06110 [Deltaproteobacteria bacterium]|nr:hypothetical protein [Deltaproteobacteria bacterium]